MMNSFRVWVTPLEYEYRVCVDGLDNARWLLDELAGSFVFRSAQPIHHKEQSSLCTFQIPRNSMLPFSGFHKLLNTIPEVTVMETTSST